MNISTHSNYKDENNFHIRSQDVFRESQVSSYINETSKSFVTESRNHITSTVLAMLNNLPNDYIPSQIKTNEFYNDFVFSQSQKNTSELSKKKQEKKSNKRKLDKDSEELHKKKKKKKHKLKPRENDSGDEFTKKRTKILEKINNDTIEKITADDFNVSADNMNITNNLFNEFKQFKHTMQNLDNDSMSRSSLGLDSVQLENLKTYFSEISKNIDKMPLQGDIISGNELLFLKDLNDINNKNVKPVTDLHNNKNNSSDVVSNCNKIKSIISDHDDGAMKLSKKKKKHKNKSKDSRNSAEFTRDNLESKFCNNMTDKQNGSLKSNNNEFEGLENENYKHKKSKKSKKYKNFECVIGDKDKIIEESDQNILLKNIKGKKKSSKNYDNSNGNKIKQHEEKENENDLQSRKGCGKSDNLNKIRLQEPRSSKEAADIASDTFTEKAFNDDNECTTIDSNKNTTKITKGNNNNTSFNASNHENNMETDEDRDQVDNKNKLNCFPNTDIKVKEESEDLDILPDELLVTILEKYEEELKLADNNENSTRTNAKKCTNNETQGKHDSSYFHNGLSTLDYKEANQILQNLFISIPFDVSPLHQLVTSLSRPPTWQQMEKISELRLEIKRGVYSPEEDKILKNNWVKFCKSNDLPPRPEIFINAFKAKNISRRATKEAVKFVQFLANGLPDRLLCSVYQRFKVLYSNLKHGRFTKEEDEFIMETLTTTKQSQHVFARIGGELNRDRLAVEKRYIWLLKDKKHQFSTERITHKQATHIVKKLLKYMKYDDVNSLKNKIIPGSIFDKIGEKLKLRPIKVQQYWLSNLYPKFFVTGSRNMREVREQFIECILSEESVTEYRHVKYTDYLPFMDGWTTYCLSKMLKNVLKVTEGLADSFRGKLKAYIEKVPAKTAFNLKHAEYSNGELRIF